MPNWPYALTTGYLPFPTSSQGKYAQSFICLSMNASTTNLIGVSLLRMRPKYYSFSTPPSLLPLFPDIDAALRSTGVISSLPYTLFVELMSLGIGSPPRRFTSFAKSVKFERDVWNVTSLHCSALLSHLTLPPLSCSAAAAPLTPWPCRRTSSRPPSAPLSTWRQPAPLNLGFDLHPLPASPAPQVTSPAGLGQRRQHQRINPEQQLRCISRHHVRPPCVSSSSNIF